MTKSTDVLIEELAQKWTDQMDIGMLTDFFYKHQVDYLRELRTDVLLRLIKSNGIE
jgi:hypothetical protein